MGEPPTYTPEFRRNAVEYVVSTGRIYAEVAETLGVNELTLSPLVCEAHSTEPSVASSTRSWTSSSRAAPNTGRSCPWWRDYSRRVA